MKTGIILLMLILLLSGCADNIPVQRNALVGTFKDKELSYWEHFHLFFIQGKHRSANHTLTLHNDSTFSLTSCYNTVTGAWKTSADSLFLLCQNNVWNTDSLQKTKASIPCLDKWIAFHVIAKEHLQLKLETTTKQDSTDNEVKSVLWLEKEN
ncbi:MAG: hypothetical protein V4538_08760 [Bacteroidota bacterium]